MSGVNPWLLLGLAGLVECAWALGLKWSDGFSRPIPTVLTLIGATCSFVMLSQAMKTLPVGTAYAIWTGIGALGTATVAMLFMGEPASLLRILGICLIVAGIAALKLA